MRRSIIRYAGSWLLECCLRSPCRGEDHDGQQHGHGSLGILGEDLRAAQDFVGFFRAPQHVAALGAVREHALGDQKRRGARVVRDHNVTPAAFFAGVHPDFVRAALAIMGVPGFKVQRWEREYDERTERGALRLGGRAYDLTA